MLNHYSLQGRMVNDPELKQTNSGVQVVNFRAAWSEKYKEKENKLFIECKAFGTQAEFIGKYFRKGQEICLEGKLNTEEWETDGQKRSKIVLMVQNAHFCGKREDSGNSAPNMTAVETDNLPF